MLLCSVAAGCSVSTLSTPAVPPTLPPSQVSEAAISDGLSHLLGFNAPALGLLPAVEETKLEPSAQPPTDEPLAISHAPLDAPAPPKLDISAKLPNGLHNPMPGGVVMGYPGDTGLDIAGNRLAVYAIAAGTLDYSEHGHTLWIGSGDTAFTIRLRLDKPIPYRGRNITHVWYAHLSKLQYQQPEGAAKRIRVQAGERLGISGVANGSPHLHLGLLLDNVVSQRWGSYLLDDAVRDVLGGFRRGHRLSVKTDKSR